MSLTNMIDTGLIQRILQNSGMSEEIAASLYGNYRSLAVPMFNLPPVLVYPIAYALVPSVAAAFASGNRALANERIESSIKYAVMIALPCALGLGSMADPILCLFYKAESAHMASPLLTYLAPSSFFVCILAVTNATLQACGRERYPVISMLAGAAVKCASSIILLDRFGIAGAPISTFICYVTVTALNLYFTVKYTGIRLDLGKTLLLPLAGSVLCSLTATIVCSLISAVAGIKIGCVAGIAAAGAVYFGFILLSGALEREEIAEILNRTRKKKGKVNLGDQRT
jgi:stage V sporulation protein B